MGFYYEKYNDGSANLIVSFAQEETSSNFFAGDSVEEAMSYFNLYKKGGRLFKKEENEAALETIGVDATEATELREILDTIATAMTDEEAIEKPIYFPFWVEGKTYAVGARVRYGGKLYKVLQAHTSQADWLPDVAHSLYACLLTDEETGEVLDWTQPDSTNGYKTGDIVKHNEKFWKSLVDNNVWEPGATGVSQWKQCAEDGSDIVVDFVAGTIYSKDDKVKFNEKIYKSLIDNNVYSPTDYPAGWEEVVE